MKFYSAVGPHNDCLGTLAHFVLLLYYSRRRIAKRSPDLSSKVSPIPNTRIKSIRLLHTTVLLEYLYNSS